MQLFICCQNIYILYFKYSLKRRNNILNQWFGFYYPSENYICDQMFLKFHLKRNCIILSRCPTVVLSSREELWKIFRVMLITYLIIISAKVQFHDGAYYNIIYIYMPIHKHNLCLGLYGVSHRVVKITSSNMDNSGLLELQ